MKTKNLTLGVFFTVVIGLFACQKELSLENISPGNPPAIVDDTTTLLKIVNIDYDINGIATDSSLRIIKNAYQNGVKRIIAKEYALPSGTDTFYTIFNYDAQNRLTIITDSSAISGTAYTYHENIYWQGTKAVKIISDDHGAAYRTDDIIYTSNGSNTLISTKTSPSQDSILIGGVLVSVSKYNSFLEVDNSFKAVSNTYINYNYLVNGSASGSPGYSYDTTKAIFSFDAKGNLTSQVNYHNGSDTNYRSPLGIDHHKDTASFTVSRNLSEDPVIFNLLKNIFGNDLLVISNHFNLDFNLGEVLGDVYNANIANNAFLQYDYYTQAINKIIYNSVFWTNGTPDPNNFPASNAVMYTATNSFDNQNRIIKSIIYSTSSNIPYYQVRYIYP